MAESLKQKTIKGVVWTGIHKFAMVLLNFISGIILARLLTPHDYGVIGMLTIFLAVSNTFIDGGFGSALIQKHRPTNEDYSTILYWNLGLSFILYGILFFCAPAIALFYDLPLLTEVLRVQGIVLMINAARIVQTNQLRKQLRFKKVAVINLSSNFLVLIITILLAWKGWGVWALVAQQLMLALFTTVLYWISSNWRPLLVFSIDSFKELFSFGGFILLSNLINTFSNNIQGLLIGKVYNTSTLGYYTKAQRTETLASTFISSVLDQVSYPVLSEAQNDNKLLIKVLKQFICTSAYLTFPLMLLLIQMARPIFLFLYSERWMPCVPYFQLLCVAGIAVCLQNINYFAVAAKGKSKILLKWTIVKRLLGLFLIVGGLWVHGIYGLLIGSVVTSWIIYIINAALVSKNIGYTLKEQFTDLAPIIMVSGVSFVFSYTVCHYTNIGVYERGALVLLLFSFSYLLLSYLFRLKSMAMTRDSLQVLKEKMIRSSR